MAKYLYTNIKKFTDELLNKFSPPQPPSTYAGSSFISSKSISPLLYIESFVQSHTQTISSAKVTTGKRIVAELMSKLNLTRVQAAALVGNFYAESGLVPSILQNKHTGGYTLAQAIKGGYGVAGYGFAQWTYKTRQINLNKFLDSKYGVGNGVNHVMTEEDNIGFVVYELKSPAFTSILNKLKSIQFSPEGEYHVLVDATMYVIDHYESPDQVNRTTFKRAERIGYAKQLL